MLMLYGSLIIMLLVALSILVIPFATNNKLMLRKHFLILSFLMILFSISFYFCSTDLSRVAQWFNHGKTHYELMVEYQKLGGIDGIIQRIQTKLKNNPNDIQGWFILSKLYAAKQDEVESKKAFAKAQELIKK